MVVMLFQARDVGDLADDRTIGGGRSASNRGIAAWKNSSGTTWRRARAGGSVVIESAGCGKANGSRACMPDGKLRVSTIPGHDDISGGTAPSAPLPILRCCSLVKSVINKMHRLAKTTGN
jgi:hypothetical protein